MVKHQPLQVYEKQLCLSCLTGIYGCRWKRLGYTIGLCVVMSDEPPEAFGHVRASLPTMLHTWSGFLIICQPLEPKALSNSDLQQGWVSQWECLWTLVLVVTFSLLLVWSYFWWEAHNDYNEFNWFLYNRSGEWSDGTVPILATTAAGFTYIALLMILALGHIAVGQQLNLHWLHKIGVTAALLTTIIGATGPFLHIGAVAAITALAWLVAGQVARAEKTIRAAAGVPECPTGPLPGPPHYHLPLPNGPQQPQATTCHHWPSGSSNVPFLMRDRTLRRTTDVSTVFPDRQFDDASLFNWTDLQGLNAGRWFLKDDPFWTVPSLTPRDIAWARNQTVSSLEQVLRLATRSNVSILFNLRRPPPGHPCRHTWINDTLETVLQSRIHQEQVMWTPEWDRDMVRKVARDLQQTSIEKQPVKDLRQKGIVRLKLRYNQASAQEIRGVPSVSSDTPQILRKVPYPVWLMSPDEYNMVWIATDLISFAIVVGIFVFQKWRLSGMRRYNPEQIMLSAAVRRSSREVNIMKEKLIFSGKKEGEILLSFTRRGHFFETTSSSSPAGTAKPPFSPAPPPPSPPESLHPISLRSSPPQLLTACCPPPPSYSCLPLETDYHMYQTLAVASVFAFAPQYWRQGCLKVSNGVSGVDELSMFAENGYDGYTNEGIAH
ncbi:hypothetical protein JZ751_012760 [Albula glossodonta]|uniref:GP-PDE domain-containing protein n=1 Tax=Albula glossodonta TaxID=121402 RepID=A0A8T2N4C8_9TELE|nr:hypothetical protein JZ751_012760 [Albula glossodonta]